MLTVVLLTFFAIVFMAATAFCFFFAWRRSGLDGETVIITAVLGGILFLVMAGICTAQAVYVSSQIDHVVLHE